VHDDDVRWLGAHCLLDCARPPLECVLGEPEAINSGIVCEAGELATAAVSGPADPTTHSFACRCDRVKPPAASGAEGSITRAKVRMRIKPDDPHVVPGGGEGIRFLY
jgi:hypothetical protein